MTGIIEGVEAREVFEKLRIGDWLFVGCVFMVVGNFIWNHNLDLILLTFSAKNMSVGLISLGLLTAIVGVVKFTINIVRTIPEDVLTTKDVKDLIKTDSPEEGIINDALAAIQERRELLIGSFLLLIGFGFWESEYDLKFPGFFFHDISAIVVSIGGCLFIFGSYKVLKGIIYFQAAISHFRKANPLISYGLIVASSLQEQVPEIILTSPPIIPLPGEIFDSIVKKSFDLLGVPSSEEGTHTIYSFLIGEEQCTVLAYGFQFAENDLSEEVSRPFVLSFIIRPPWSNQEDLATYIWDNRDNFAKFFNHLRRVRDQLKDSVDHEVLLAEMDSFRTFFTEMILTIRKKYIEAFFPQESPLPPQDRKFSV